MSPDTLTGPPRCAGSPEPSPPCRTFPPQSPACSLPCKPALGNSDPAQLLGTLSAAAPHLRTAHPDLTDHVTDMGRQTDEMRENEPRQRSSNRGDSSRWGWISQSIPPPGPR